MNHERDITPAQRELLGPRQADELVGDERWLAGQPIAPELPAGLHARLTAAIRGELAKPRRAARLWRWACAAAAILVFAAIAAFVAQSMLHRDSDSGTSQIANGHEARAVAAAQQAIDDYLKPIDPAEVQLHFEQKRIDQAMAAPDGADNPWESLALAIEKQ
jgi:hypothetical protein